MLLDNYKKESPIVGVAGLGGGINSYIFLSSGGGGDFVISKSLRFNSGDSAYLNRTPSSASNRKTWTWSGWVRRSDISATKTIWASSTLSSIRFATNSEIEWLYEGNYGLKTNAVFRDISAWYHFVFVLDTTNSTADDRQKIYVNGTQLTSFASRGNPSLNSDKQWNAASAHAIGAKPDASVEFDGHLAEINFVDGQALSPTDFGEFDDESNIYGGQKSVSSLNLKIGVHYYYTPVIKLVGMFNAINNSAKTGGSNSEVTYRDTALKFGGVFSY